MDVTMEMPDDILKAVEVSQMVSNGKNIVNLYLISDGIGNKDVFLDTVSNVRYGGPEQRLMSVCEYALSLRSELRQPSGFWQRLKYLFMGSK